MSLKPFWLHCNFCFDMKASSYRITNCGKVFCPSPACLQAVSRPTCQACRGPCRRHIPLDDTAPPEIKNLFKGISARIKSIQETEAFQEKQMSDFLEAQRSSLQRKADHVHKMDTEGERQRQEEQSLMEKVENADRQIAALSREKEHLLEGLEEHKRMERKRKALKEAEEQDRRRELQYQQQERQRRKLELAERRERERFSPSVDQSQSTALPTSDYTRVSGVETLRTIKPPGAWKVETDWTSRQDSTTTGSVTTDLAELATTKGQEEVTLNTSYKSFNITPTSSFFTYRKK